MKFNFNVKNILFLVLILFFSYIILFNVLGFKEGMKEGKDHITTPSEDDIPEEDKINDTEEVDAQEEEAEKAKETEEEETEETKSKNK